MPFSAEPGVKTLTGNGSANTLALDWPYYDKSHVRVIHIGTTGTVTAQTLTTHFTLTDAAVESGGTLTMVTTPATGEFVKAWLDIPLVQNTRHDTAGADSATTKNQDLDKLWQAIAVLNEKVTRAWRLPFADTGTDAVSTERLADLLGKYALFNSSTGKLEGTAVVSASEVVAASTSAQGIAELLTDSEANDGNSAGGDNQRILTRAIAGGWLGRALDPGGRLTLTSGTPVTAGDVTAAAAVYWEPMHHNLIPIWDGTRFNPQELGSSSLTLNNPAHVANTNYDVFAGFVDVADFTNFALGTGPAWSSDTARGTGAGTTQLEFWKGRLVNAVSITLRNSASTYTVAARSATYLGTIRTSGTATAEDSFARRFVWNAYNRRPRSMRVTEATNTWAYTTAAFQQANASTANQLDFVLGLSEDEVWAEVIASAENSAANVQIAVGVGLDAVNTPATACLVGAQVTAVAAQEQTLRASWRGFPGIGRHYLSWVEFSAATGTTTWYGDNNIGTISQSGIQGVVWG